MCVFACVHKHASVCVSFMAGDLDGKSPYLTEESIKILHNTSVEVSLEGGGGILLLYCLSLPHSRYLGALLSLIQDMCTHTHIHQSSICLTSTLSSPHGNHATPLPSFFLSLSFSPQHTCFQTVSWAAMVLRQSPLTKKSSPGEGYITLKKKLKLNKNRLEYNREDSLCPVVFCQCIWESFMLFIFMPKT